MQSIWSWNNRIYSEMKKWEIEGQQEFDFADCYIQNYPPLDLSKYAKDRNLDALKFKKILLPLNHPS